jgi:acyl-CoA oxidase
MVAADGMEDCRKACGGHGFLQCSGLPELVTTYLQNPTVEGDNYMLPQQVVKVLLKLLQAVHNGDDLTGYKMCDSYDLVPSLKSILNKSPERLEAISASQMQDLVVLTKAFRHRCASLLVQVAAQLASSSKSQHDAWNDALVEMLRVSRSYAQFLLLRNFIKGVNEERDRSVIGDSEAAVLFDLARLLALYWMERDLGDFLEDGYVLAKQVSWVRSMVLQLLDTIRPNAVALVDAWDFSDRCLKSALGRFDGDVYPAIMEAAERDPLNRTDPGVGYEKHLKRLIDGGIGAYTPTASRL